MTDDRRRAIVRRVLSEHLEIAAEMERPLDMDELADAIIAELDGTRH